MSLSGFDSRSQQVQPEHEGSSEEWRYLEEEDVLFDQQWGLRRIDATEAWPITTGSHDAVVAVIDTGIASNHPDLAENIVHSTCFTFSSNTGSSGNGEWSLYPTTGWHGTDLDGDGTPDRLLWVPYATDFELLTAVIDAADRASKSKI